MSTLIRKLLVSTDVDSLLQGLVRYLNAALLLTGSAVTLVEGDHLWLAAGLPAHTARLGQLEREISSGPCITAHETGKVVAIADLRTQVHRWPRYCVMADEVGVSAVAGLPLRLGSDRLGVVGMYVGRPHEWTKDELAAGSVMVDVAASYLLNDARIERAQRLTEQLQHALDSRTIIEQAKGIVAARYGIGVEAAFQRIRRHARDHNVSVHLVAEAVVHVGLSPT